MTDVRQAVVLVRESASHRVVGLLGDLVGAESHLLGPLQIDVDAIVRHSQCPSARWLEEFGHLLPHFQDLVSQLVQDGKVLAVDVHVNGCGRSRHNIRAHLLDLEPPDPRNRLEGFPLNRVDDLEDVFLAFVLVAEGQHECSPVHSGHLIAREERRPRFEHGLSA